MEKECKTGSWKAGLGLTFAESSGMAFGVPAQLYENHSKTHRGLDLSPCDSWDGLLFRSG
jgi:hypothetical protein